MGCGRYEPGHKNSTGFKLRIVIIWEYLVLKGGSKLNKIKKNYTLIIFLLFFPFLLITCDDNEKEKYHLMMMECAENFGGVNFFLQLLEAVRKHTPHPLTAKHSEFKFSRGNIRWEKVIFKDKLSLLFKARVSEGERGNLLPSKDDKTYKNIMNLIRTLAPIEFTVTPKNINDGEGFSFKPFDLFSILLMHL